MFKITIDHVKHMAKINFFKIPDDQMVFFGFRGCLPVADDAIKWKKNIWLN